MMMHLHFNQSVYICSWHRTAVAAENMFVICAFFGKTAIVCL